MTLVGEFASREDESLFLEATRKSQLDSARLCVIATSLTSIAFFPVDMVVLSGERLAFFLADRVLITILLLVTMLLLPRMRSVAKLIQLTHLHQYTFFALNALVFNHPVLERHGGMFFPLIAITLFINLPGSFRRVMPLCLFAAGISLLFWGVLRPVSEAANDLAVITSLTLVACVVGGIGRSQFGRMRREEYRHIERGRQVNQVLLEAMEAAEAGAEAKAQFLAVMSHEIRTPMNGILGLSRLLRDRPMPPEDHDRLEMIHDSAEALLIILDDILDISKLESGQLDFEAVSFDPRDAIGGVIALLQARADEKGLLLSVEIAPQIPAWVTGDVSRFRQILLNLVGNALKFTEAGSISVRAKVASGFSGILFSVTDTGIGLDEQQKARLFQPFNQADASISRRFGGTGLGLAISKKLVEAQEGEIGVESAPGIGSTFWFHLPLEAAVEPELLPKHELRSVTPPSLSILLAEDNLINQKVALGILGKDNHRVTIANSGVEALAWARRGGFDLILMDMQMPEMDGLEAARLIRDLPPPMGTVPIIALTANAMRRDEERCIAAGMEAHVAKPIDPETLFSTIVRVLEGEKVWGNPLGPAKGTRSATANAFALDEVAVFLGRDGVIELVALLATQVVMACERLRRSEGDPKQVREIAHDLKGMAGTAGCTTLAALALKIEAAALAGRRHEMLDLIAGLDESWFAAKLFLGGRFNLSIADDGSVTTLAAG